MENKEIDKLFISFSDEMRKWAADADWFDSAHSSGLSELYRYGQKTIGDFIESPMLTGNRISYTIYNNRHRHSF